MKIAVTTAGAVKESKVDARFGRATCFMVFDDETGSWESLDNIQNVQAPQGAGIQAAATVVNAGCGVLICGHCGPKAFGVLKESSVEVYSITDGTAEEAVQLYRDGKLPKLDSADVEGHW